MEFRIINIKRTVLLYLFLQTSSLFCIYGQGQSTAAQPLSFSDLTAEEIVTLIESEHNVVFNFLPEALPQGKFSASLLFTKENVCKTLSLLWNRSVSFVDDTHFVISSKESNLDASLILESVKGTVVDNENNQPIVGASLYIPSIRKGTVSDHNGLFNYQGFVLPSDKIIIKYLGYSDFETTVGRIQRQSIVRLRPRDHVLDDIVIRSTRKKTEILTLSDDLDPSTLNIPSASDHDAVVLAQSVPGVYNSSENAQDLQIRGGPPDQVSYTWNSIRLFQNSLYYGRIGAVNPFMVDQIRITRNGASADEDASASGAINMQSVIDSFSTSNYRLAANALYFNLGLQKSLFENKLHFKGAYRHSYTPLFSTRIHDQYFANTFQFGQIPDVAYYLDLFGLLNERVLIPELSYGDRSFSLNWTPSKYTTISLNHISYGNTFEYTQENTLSSVTPYDSLTQNTSGYSLKLDHQWNEKVNSTILFSSSDYKHVYQSTDDKNDKSALFLNQINSIGQQSIEMTSQWREKNWSIKAGYDYIYWDVQYNAEANREYQLFYNAREDSQSGEHSTYLEFGIHTSPRYNLLLGVRGSSFGYALLGRNIIEPRLHGSLFINSDLTLHGHHGAFHQNINRRNFNTPLNADNGFWLLSDERPESDNFIHIVQSKQTSLGIKYNPNQWLLTADIYYKTAENVWTSAFDFTLNEDFFEFSTIRIQGLELSSAYTFGNWKFVATYDYVDDKIRARESDVEIPSPYTQPHRFSLNTIFSKGHLSVSTQFTLNTGRAFSVPSRFYSTITQFGEEYFLDFENYFTQRVPNYMRLDLSVKYKFDSSFFDECSIYFDLINLTSRENIIKNEYYINYRTETPEQNVFVRRGLPFIWNAGFEVRF